MLEDLEDDEDDDFSVNYNDVLKASRYTEVNYGNKGDIEQQMIKRTSLTLNSGLKKHD
jgi:hypothetical protein